MKISEKVTAENRLLYVEQKHDVAETLRMAALIRQAREANVRQAIQNDWIPLGVVPGVMARDWANEAGVRMDDHEAMQDVLKRKLLDGQFSKLRISDKRW